jgi:hypothetical protein
VPYITSVEKIGYDRGVEEEAQRLRGREQALVLRQLNRKVGSIDDRTSAQINSLSIDQLEALGEALLDFGSIADLTTWLDNQG